MSILDYLSEIKDKRRKQGQRYPLGKTLCLMLIGTLAGRVGYRAVSRFCKEHEEYLSKVLDLKHGVPSHVSLTAIVEGVELEDFEMAVNSWKSSLYNESRKEEELDVIALDGKAIRSTVRNGKSKDQNFVSFVNALSLSNELVVGVMSYEQASGSEQDTLRKLIGKLGLQDVVYTMDAGHCSKKL